MFVLGTRENPHLDKNSISREWTSGRIELLKVLCHNPPPTPGYGYLHSISCDLLPRGNKYKPLSGSDVWVMDCCRIKGFCSGLFFLLCTITKQNAAFAATFFMHPFFMHVEKNISREYWGISWLQHKIPLNYWNFFFRRETSFNKKGRL